MKKIDSRSITRKFLNTLNEVSEFNACTSCYTIPCCCTNRVDIEVDPEIDYVLDSIPGESHHEIDPDNDGIINQEDLFKHFDLNNNGIVTTNDYVDHTQYHADNPETLDHYRKDVPCSNSYNSCYNHHNDDKEILRNCITQTGASCMQSGIQALIDVLMSIKKSGII